MPRKVIDRQTVQDLFREYKRLTYQREELDSKLNALTTAEREHYYDLIRHEYQRAPVGVSRTLGEA